VSGGVPRARTGDLAIMLGGDDDAAPVRPEPLLRCVGSTVTRTGVTGSVHAMGALNNLVSAGGFLIGIEALLIGGRFGLDLMVKDLGIALGVARDTGTTAPFAALCREMWAAAAALLGPGRDHTAAVELSERLAGSALGSGTDDDEPQA
jgi:3-hydroxyisobutyrate dehydrogenase